MSKPTNLASRAICCLCGAVRKVDGRTRLDDPYDEARTTTLACERCDTDTVHARIGGRSAKLDPSTRQTQTSAAEAKRKLDATVRTVQGFNVDIHFRTQSKRLREEEYALVYWYDKSKSRWRIELDPNLPPRTAEMMLRHAWKAIATDDRDGITWDPRNGVAQSPSDKWWSAGAADLLRDIDGALDAERERFLCELRDERGVGVDHLPNAAVLTDVDVAADAAQRAADLLRDIGEEGTR